MRTTTADEYRDDARASVDSAVVALSKIVVYQCEGTSDYVPEYRRKLRDILTRLAEIREEL